MDGYIEILRDWERRVADPAVCEHLDVLLPDFAFRRIAVGGQKDHWASRYKADFTLPKRRTAEKTVVYKGDMHLCEQFIREKGAEAFIALLRSSVPYWEYLHRYKRG
jgi:hypothetical protein